MAVLIHQAAALQQEVELLENRINAAVIIQKDFHFTLVSILDFDWFRKYSILIGQEKYDTKFWLV